MADNSTDAKPADKPAAKSGEHPASHTDHDVAALEQRIKTLETELARSARGAIPLTSVPEHSGGVGVDAFAPSWSQYDQELSRAGEHPHQRGEHADWLEHPDKTQQHRAYGRVRDDDPRVQRR